MHTNFFGRGALRAAATCLCVTLAACNRSGSNESSIRVVGERAGVLVWHPVDGATRYHTEILDLQGRVIFEHQATDTVAPLPPLFVPERGSQWRVRAYRGDKELVVSARQPII
jgi:hypothetical protein